MVRALLAVLLLFTASVAAFNVVPRRQALQQLGLGLATLATPLAPASAKSKASVLPNKPEGVGANAGQYLSELRKKEYEAVKGDKGIRGVASKDFDKNDTVQRNRDKYGGLAYDEKGRKKASGTRARTPEDLGLKQWGG